MVHAGADIIREIITKRLVDGLSTYRDLKMQDQCKDCIYIDIWDPTQIQSAGGAQYFMLMMDGFLSFRTVAFLSSKSANVILKVFKAYQMKSKCQTGKKIKKI